MDEFHLGFLSSAEIGRIVNFLGYGRLSAPVWFIGFEEGLGKMDSEDTIKNLKTRGSFENVMDLHKAHIRLQEGGKPIDIETKPKFTQVWQYMAKIMLARTGQKDWRKLESAEKYIRSQLGRERGCTFMTELSPIPTRRTTDKKWMVEFTKRDSKLAEKITQRNDELKRMLNVNAPRLVICYGSSKRADFAKLLGVEWQSVYGVCASRDTKHLLLPFFGNGHMSHSVIESLLYYRLLG